MTISSEELLMPLVEKAEEDGLQPHLTRYDFSEQKSQDIEFIKQHIPNLDVDQIQKTVKTCLANGYLEHYLVGNEYAVRLTTKGFYAGKSSLETKKQEDSKTAILKISDWVNKHNGILTLYAMIVGSIGLIIALLEFLKNE